MAIFQQGIFTFDPRTDTPETVARKRAIVAQIMGSQNAPKTIGEGLNALGDGIVANVLNRRADAAAQAGQESAASAWNPLLASMGVQQFPSAPGGGDTASASSDVPSQRVAQAFGDNATQPGGGDASPLAFTGVSQAGKGWTTVQTADGQTIRRTGSRNWRNNNPGNIEYGPFAKSAGAVGTDGRFAVFPTLEAGRAAKAKLLFDSPNYRDKTLAQAINRWAPPSENNTASYYGQLASAAGVDPNVRMSDLTPQQRQAVLSRMEVVEGFRPGREETIGGPAATAVNAFAAGQPVPPAPVQVASLDSGAGLPDIAPVPTPSPGPANVPVASGKGDRVANLTTRSIPLQPGPMAAGDAQSSFVDRMTSPQSMTGGAPMPMAGMPASAPQPPAQPVQVAQANSAGPDLSRIPVAAGGNAGAYQQGQGPSLQLLMQAANNPWLNENQRAVVNMMLKQRIGGAEQNDFQQRASAAAQYGLDPNSAEGRNFILTGKLPEQRGGAAELGLNPQYGLDKDGNPVLLQLGKDGNVVQSKLPDGVHLSKEPIKVDLGTSWGLIDPITRQVIGNVPKDLKGAAEDTEQGKLQAALRQSLPSDMMNTRQALSDIDALINNPGLDSIVGGADQYRPSWLLGDQGRDAAARLNQIKGKTFLQAYATLKGGGAITEVEGKKAEDAIGRLDRAQDEKTFRQALSDLRDVIAEGQNVMLQKAGIPQDQWDQYLKGAAGAGGGTKRLKFNPATGELE